MFTPAGSGTGIGIAGIDHQRPDALSGSQMLPAQNHRCGTKTVLGEHSRHGTAGCQLHYQQVTAIGVAHARLGHA